MLQSARAARGATEHGGQADVSDEQRVAVPPPGDSGPEPAPGQQAASIATAGLVVPWSARQALIGATATLVPLIAVQVWAAVVTPTAPRSSKPLSPQQDWTAAIVIILAQLVVEGIFL